MAFKQDIVCLRVYPVEDALPGNERWLIIRQDPEEGTVKYQMSNADPDATIERLAKMSCSRYWIERALEDAKGLAGLADYEIRSWRGWHHHVAMSFFAMLAILMMELQMGRKSDMLTLQDVKEILEFIKAKHKARESARESHHRKRTLSATDADQDSGSRI
jgi:hypothetical protein